MATLKDFKPDSRNANKGKAKGQKMIVRSMQEDGFGRSALIDKNGNIIAGNKTTEAAAEVFGVDVEPIIVETDGKRPVYVKRTDLDLTDPKGAARRLAYRDNLTSHFSFELDPAVVMADIEAGFDFEAIDVSLPDLGEMLGKAADDLLNGDNAGEDTEPQVDKAEELRVKWGVEPGQMWQLGEHRIICGDCTDPAVVARVMGGEKADMMFTDPPYKLEIGIGGAFNHEQLKQDLSGLTDFNPEAFLCTIKTYFDGNINAYIFCNTALVPDYCNWAKQNGFNFNILTWHKKSFIPAGGNHHFPDTEYIIFISRTPTFNSGLPSANYGKYWIADNEKSKDHPTIKPLVIIEDEIKISSNIHNIVVDPYSGSGTTIIACENLKRRCRAIEIDAGYVAVAIERWATHTGKTPELLTNLTL